MIEAPALFGARASVPSHLDTDFSAKLKASGGNSGNLLIGYSLISTLGLSPQDTPLISIASNIAELRERYQIVLVAASNFVNPRFDFGEQAKFFEKLALPVFTVGLGAQLEARVSPKDALSPGTKRFVQVLSDLAPHSVGVRGAFTAEVLSKLGVKNTELVGCPSAYLTSGGMYVKSQNSGFTVNSDPIRGDDRPSRAVHKKLMRLSLAEGAPYVLQNEAKIALATGDDRHLDGAMTLLELQENDAKRVMRNSQVFFDMERWLKFCSGFSFSIGMRFHGNMVSLQAGQGAIVVAHDNRTQELCELLHVPHLSTKEFLDLDLDDHEHLSELAHSRRFWLRQALMKDVYSEFVRRNLGPHKIVFQERSNEVY